MEILITLLILLIVTRTFGEVAHRFGQPALIGELVAGIALGALVSAKGEWFPMLEGLTENPAFTSLTDLGIFFLMLYGGVKLRASDLAEVSSKSMVVATSGLLVPVTVGFGFAWAFIPENEIKVAQCLLVGTALAITAVPVSVRVLMDLGQLDSRAGRTIVSAAIFDDVLSIILLAVLTSFIGSGEFPGLVGLLLLGGKVLLFFAVTLVVGKVIVPRVGRLVKSLKTAEFEFSSLLLAALAFAVLAEVLGLHFILGAFAAGLLFERRIAGEAVYGEVEKRIAAITLGFLAPVFFASIGLHLDLRAVTEVPVFLCLLVLIAFLTKLIGAGVPAYLTGLSRREATAVGVGMSARGAVELIIADIALRAGLFSQPDPPPPIIANMFSCIVIVAVVTTVVTPVGLRLAFGSPRPDEVTDPIEAPDPDA